LFAITVGLAACGGDDGGYNPPSDDGDDDPDAMRPDADPNAIDAATTPDAIGDGEAPVIVPLNPLPGGLAHGVVTITAQVTDADGIAAVGATFGDFAVTMVEIDDEIWSGTIDTAPLALSAGPTIAIRASDNSGAESLYPYVIVLDNGKPIASLDPPRVRLFDAADATCSREFDPLGGDAPDDGESVRGGAELRARVVDQGNEDNAATDVYVPRAGVGSVDVYVLDDSTRPLIVDTDGDGVCDDINPELVPTPTPDAPNEALVVALEGISATGAADFRADVLGVENAGVCTGGDAATAPPPLCAKELQAQVVIDTEVTDQPQIYGIPVVDEFNCLGYFVDMTAHGIADGWACAAVRATDNLGNRNVSAPLRLCIDNDISGDCLPIGDVAAEGVRPNCTGTVSGGVVNNTPCTPGEFLEYATPDDFEIILP
jgi:hypothetical protein